jgi:hypothetical protein
MIEGKWDGRTEESGTEDQREGAKSLPWRRSSAGGWREREVRDRDRDSMCERWIPLLVKSSGIK